MAKLPSEELIRLVADAIQATSPPDHMRPARPWAERAATRVLVALAQRRKRRFHWLHDWTRWEAGEGDWIRRNGSRLTTEIQYRQCADCGKEQIRRLTE